MTIKAFIRAHRADIDSHVRKALRRPDYELTDEERRLWLLNDEALYNWARSKGVRI